MARIARSLGTLRDQVNRSFPKRRTDDDGWIGDAAHAQRNSDHNPNEHGVVTALDLTHDPAHGFDSYAFADMLKALKDPRIKYLISNRRISNPLKQNWTWRDYHGDDPHTGHIHISVSADPELYDDPSSWELSMNDASNGFGENGSGELQTFPGLGDFQAGESGRGSWYAQFNGKYNWVDTGDKPDSAALGVPDSAQGCAFYNRSTLGDWFVVTAPNGMSLRMPQTDIGPHPRTGRKIDISAHMAEAFGYTPRNFPTDGVFRWVRSSPPQGLEHLSPKQQAIQWARGRVQPEPHDGGNKPSQTNPLLLILMLILASREKLMTGDAKSGQGVEIEKMLLAQLLQSMATGTQIDTTDLLSVILNGKLGGTVAHPIALPAPGPQPTDTNTLLTQLLYQIMTGKPWPTPPKPNNGGGGKKPEPSAMTRPSVQLSAAGFGLSTILQALGFVGTPFGMGTDPTPIGTLATLVPMITGLVGATGGWGALAGLGLRLVGGLFGRRTA
jgi:hypothetical protein